MTPKEAHLRNMVICTDCRKFYRATKYLPKDVIQDCKDYDAYGTRIYPEILCGKCGTKYWNSHDRRYITEKTMPRRHKKSKRRFKIKLDRFRRTHFYGNE